MKALITFLHPVNIVNEESLTLRNVTKVDDHTLLVDGCLAPSYMNGVFYITSRLNFHSSLVKCINFSE